MRRPNILLAIADDLSWPHLSDVVVPSYLPDCDEVRSDFLDYALEVERFDQDLGKMLALLEDRDELDNTIVLVQGITVSPFPGQKPLCIRMDATYRWWFDGG